MGKRIFTKLICVVLCMSLTGCGLAGQTDAYAGPDSYADDEKNGIHTISDKGLMQAVCRFDGQPLFYTETDRRMTQSDVISYVREGKDLSRKAFEDIFGVANALADAAAERADLIKLDDYRTQEADDQLMTYGIQIYEDANLSVNPVLIESYYFNCEQDSQTLSLDDILSYCKEGRIGTAQMP